jgi:hypothetical protein
LSVAPEGRDTELGEDADVVSVPWEAKCMTEWTDNDGLQRTELTVGGFPEREHIRYSREKDRAHEFNNEAS